jgi:coenzyme F420 hydrogenase subunit beta
MIREWPTQETIQSCVFKTGWLGTHEIDVFGRERSIENTDEMSFGICKERLVGCIKNPISGAAWNGVITSIARKAFETGMVEAVATLHRGNEDFFSPQPVLARSTEAILTSSGNKPVVSPILVSLHAAYQQGIKRLLVIGAACHTHALRDFKKRFTYLNNMDVYVVGIPCVSNVTLKNLRRVLKMLSDSHETVRHYEFMQDFNVHLRHEDGSIEKLPYFCLPQEFTGINLVVPACMCCFDYMNSLADITVGYAGAPFNMKKLYQWIIVRTDKGDELRNLIADELETVSEETVGDSKKAVKNAARNIVDQMRLDSHAKRKTGRKIPIWAGRILAAMMRHIGPRGLEYAHYGVDMHMIRDYYYVKFYYPQLRETLVPKHVYRILEKYDFTP